MNKFDMSLFKRLDNHFQLSGNNSPVILLDRQYRMDPEIAYFPNQYIYNGKIQNDEYVNKYPDLSRMKKLLFKLKLVLRNRILKRVSSLIGFCHGELNLVVCLLKVNII